MLVFTCWCSRRAGVHVVRTLCLASRSGVLKESKVSGGVSKAMRVILVVVEYNLVAYVVGLLYIDTDWLVTVAINGMEVTIVYVMLTCSWTLDVTYMRTKVVWWQEVRK